MQNLRVTLQSIIFHCSMAPFAIFFCSHFTTKHSRLTEKFKEIIFSISCNDQKAIVKD